MQLLFWCRFTILFVGLISVTSVQASPARTCLPQEVTVPAELQTFKTHSFSYKHLTIAKAFQTSECKTLVLASYHRSYDGNAELLLIRYAAGAVDTTYNPEGYQSLRVSLLWGDAPVTLNFIKERNRIYFYGLVSSPRYSSSRVGVGSYAFALNFDGLLNKTAVPWKSGVAMEYFDRSIMITEFKNEPAIIENSRISFDFKVRTTAGEFLKGTTAFDLN